MLLERQVFIKGSSKTIMLSWVFLTNSVNAKAPPKAIFPIFFLYLSFVIFFCLTGLSYNVSCSENALLLFYLLLSGFPILLHASTSLGETLTSMSESTEITVSSKSLSETCAGIPETTIVFLLPYCSMH